jgi:hypothetical protein
MVPTECLFRQPVGFHNPALFQQVRLLRPSLHHEGVCERGQRRRDEGAIGRQSGLLQSQSARTWLGLPQGYVRLIIVGMKHV